MSDISVSVVVTPQDALALWDRLREGRQWASADALWEWLQGRSQPVVRDLVVEMDEADTLAALLDNVVTAQSLSRELREQAHGQARKYLYDRRYVHKHVHLWEAANGPVPQGHCLKCLDGDKTNCDPSNWQMIPRGVLARLNGGRHKKRLAFDEASPEIKPVLMTLAKVEHQALTLRRKAAA